MKKITNSKTKIVFDARPISGVYTGLGRFTGELIISLVNQLSNNARVDLLIIMPELAGENRYVNEILAITANNVSYYYTKIKCVSLKNLLIFGGVISKFDADIYIYPHFDLPLNTNTPSMIVVHDLFPLVVSNYFPKFHKLKSIFFRLITLQACYRAVCVFSVSKTTRIDLIRLVSNIIEDKIKVIYEGLTLKVNGNNALSKECKLIFPRRRFLLYVGDRRPHKNLRRILELYTGLVKSNCYDGDLIIVGNKTNYDFDVDQYCHDGVICVGNVEDSKLDLYYRNCDALIFMSKYEGFGLPILEAASRKKRIISSDGGALAEIIPSWAYVIKNNDSLSNHYDSLSRYLNAEIDTSDLLEYMHDYRWERVADKILASIADFIAIQVQESPR